jgi:predicted nucleic acid-binding protein
VTILIDTNILLRIVDQTAKEHSVCVEALRVLDDRGEDLAICAQLMIEFWSVATRPSNANGLGLSPQRAAFFLDGFTQSLKTLPEPADIAVYWRRTVEQYSVISKQAHDARLVALMDAHGVRQILTLNLADFARYTNVQSLPPTQVIAGNTP